MGRLAMRFLNNLSLQIIAQMPRYTLEDTSLQPLRSVRDKSQAGLCAGNPQYTDCRIVLRRSFHLARGSPGLTQRFVVSCPFPAIFSRVLPTPPECGQHKPDDASDAFCQAVAYS